MSELIFVVDSEYRDRQVAQLSLEQAGYAVKTFSSLADLHGTLSANVTLLLIASRLSDGSGLDACRRVRSSYPQMGILMLTSAGRLDQGGAALRSGADGFLSKPFATKKLLSKVRATLRQSAFPLIPGPADLVIDHAAVKLLVRGNEVVITYLEFRLINYLARHRGFVVTRDMLLDAVWGETHFVTPRTVDVCIRRLREKIEPDITRPTYVKTVRGIGYRFDAVASWSVATDECDCAFCSPSHGLTTVRLGKGGASHGAAS